MEAKKGSNSVYVQGFPPETISEAEVFRLFSRCGMIKKDPLSNKPKIKLYMNKTTMLPKGDALVTYVLTDSVFLAIQQFDGYAIQPPQFVLKVSEAEFTPAPPKDKSTTTIDSTKHTTEHSRAKRVRRLQERAMLSWDDSETKTSKEAALLIVVLKGMFDSRNVLTESEIRDLEVDLVEGLAEILPGEDEIKKITLFAKHPEAVILIRFAHSKVALDCVELMNGRWFDGRQIQAELWDGITEYAPQSEKPEEREKREELRLQAFEKYLEGNGEEDES